MEVYLKDVTIDVPSHKYIESCNSAGEYSDILCDLATKLISIDSKARRIILRSIADGMSEDGRNFIEQMFAAVNYNDTLTKKY